MSAVADLEVPEHDVAARGDRGVEGEVEVEGIAKTDMDTGIDDGNDSGTDIGTDLEIDVEEEMAEACGYLHVAQARLVRAVVVMLRTGAWQVAGVRSPEHWLCWQAGVSQATAVRLVKVARRWHELPGTMAAFAAGELSLDQVVPIVERAPDWADARSAELARCATVSQLRSAMRGYPVEQPADPADPDGPDGPADRVPLGEPSSPQDAHGPVDPHAAEGVDHDEPHDDPERLTLVQTTGGSWRLTATLDADHGLELDAVLREIGDRGFDTFGQRPSRAACLVELVRGHVDGLPADRRHRYRVHFHLDTGDAGDAGVGGVRVTDPCGYPVPHWLRELICCDPDVTPIWERHGEPIARGATTGTIHPDIRRHVTRRDAGRCRVPGCPSTAHHLHHIRHREHGGTHDPHNLVSVCATHHRAHHRGHLVITGRPDRPPDHPDTLTFTNPRAGPIHPNRANRPPTTPAPPPHSRYQHPLGEPLDTWSLDHTPPPTT